MNRLTGLEISTLKSSFVSETKKALYINNTTKNFHVAILDRILVIVT